MDVVKDLLLLVLFLIIIFKYIMLYKSMLKERNYLINTLSHDLRVSTIAQIRGLDILQKNYAQEELIQEINNSCHFTLDMINVILNTYRYKKGENFIYQK